MYDNDLVMKMHGSTTTREYIRRFVRLVRMDKSALRVDTSRQYWTFLNWLGIHHLNLAYVFAGRSRSGWSCPLCSRDSWHQLYRVLCRMETFLTPPWKVVRSQYCLWLWVLYWSWSRDRFHLIRSTALVEYSVTVYGNTTKSVIKSRSGGSHG